VVRAAPVLVTLVRPVFGLYSRADKVDATKKRSVIEETHKVNWRIYFVKQEVYLQAADLR
jgi:hypothetical protein